VERTEYTFDLQSECPTGPCRPCCGVCNFGLKQVAEDMWESVLLPRLVGDRTPYCYILTADYDPICGNWQDITPPNNWGSNTAVWATDEEGNYWGPTNDTISYVRFRRAGLQGPSGDLIRRPYDICECWRFTFEGLSSAHADYTYACFNLPPDIQFYNIGISETISSGVPFTYQFSTARRNCFNSGRDVFQFYSVGLNHPAYPEAQPLGPDFKIRKIEVSRL